MEAAGLEVDPFYAYVNCFDALNHDDDAYQQFEETISIFTSATTPCSLCIRVTDCDAYKSLCRRALTLPICASSTVDLAVNFAKIVDVPATEFAPLHVVYHFQVNVCFESCSADNWSTNAIALCIFGKAVHMIAEDAEWARKCDELWYDADVPLPAPPITKKEIMILLKEYKKIIKCHCREHSYVEEDDDFPIRDPNDYDIQWVEPRYRFLTLCADPRLCGGTGAECQLCNTASKGPDLDTLEIKYQLAKTVVGKPINALLASMTDENEAHISKHYITDPLCAFNRCTRIKRKPCTQALVGAILYKLVQRSNLDAESLISDLIYYLYQHRLLGHPTVNKTGW